MCNPVEFSEIMEIPVSILSSKKYETSVSIDVTEPHGSRSLNTSEGQTSATDLQRLGSLDNRKCDFHPLFGRARIESIWP
jgi:hypothetical protein